MNEVKTVSSAKKNNFKSGKKEKREQRRRDDASLRSASHSGFFGVKEKVKMGAITACEGLKHVPENTQTGKWLVKQAKLQLC